MKELSFTPPRISRRPRFNSFPITSAPCKANPGPENGDFHSTLKSTDAPKAMLFKLPPRLPPKRVFRV